MLLGEGVTEVAGGETEEDGDNKAGEKVASTTFFCDRTLLCREQDRGAFRGSGRFIKHLVFGDGTAFSGFLQETLGLVILALG